MIFKLKELSRETALVRTMLIIFQKKSFEIGIFSKME